MINKSDFDKIVEESRQYTGKEIDRLLIYLPSGALVLTIAFGDMIDLKDAGYKIFLLSTWIFFALSLVLKLFSHYSLFYMYNYFILKNKARVKYHQKVGKYLSNGALFLFISGLASFIFYLFINLTNL